MATEIKASKKIGDIEKEAAILFDFGETLTECITKFGEGVVFSNAKASFKITAQSAMRRYLEAGKTQEEISGLMASWKPGVAMERIVDPVAALLSQWGSMTEERKAEIIKKLKAGK